MHGFLEQLTWRGLVQDMTPGLAERLQQGPITAYIGFDPTAPSLQVGNLVPVMLLAHLQRAGGRAIVVMGGGTGLIGDPSGKQEERPLVEKAVLDANLRMQADQFRHLLPGVDIVNNATWLAPLSLVEFLRDIGKHFTISVMLQKESVKTRLEEGISYTEFSYMLIQAYDFWHLYRDRKCEMQMGGSDQWGNITAGIELIRRTEGGEAHGLSAPLVTTASGAKFGKTEAGALWLDSTMTPAYVFYRFWVNTNDSDVEQYLKKFTFKTREEIIELMKEHRANPGSRTPHHALAFDLTARVHGPEEAENVQREARAVFEARNTGALEQTIQQILKTVPRHTFRWNRANPPKYEDLFVAAGLASSKGDARRLIAGKGLYLNENVSGLPEYGAEVPESAVIAAAGARYVLLRKGKKNHKLLHVEFT